jgi:hypothetical protein
MSNWVQVEEDGRIFYVNEDMGNIVKISDNMFVSCVPKILKFGPFSTLEEAKEVFNKKQEMELALDEMNADFVKRK